MFPGPNASARECTHLFADKLSVAQITRTRQEGLLELWRMPGEAHAELHARLWDPNSDHLTLANMDNVQVARSERGGGLLLRGTTLNLE